MVKATFEFVGLTEYLKKLDTLGVKSTGFLKRAVYDGAAVVGKAMRSQIEALPVNDGKYAPGNTQIVGVSKEQKQGLMDGLGFTKMHDKGGVIYTKLGFDGYNSVKTKKYPKGQANAMIANAINSGTSKRPKNQFVNRAVKASKDESINAMSKRFDFDIEEFMNK